MAPHCFNLHLFGDSDVERFFICLLAIRPLWRSVCSVPLPIFHWIGVGFLVLSCMSSLYILGTNPSLAVSLANVFSHLLGFFVLLVFFPVQNFVV